MYNQSKYQSNNCVNSDGDTTFRTSFKALYKCSRLLFKDYSGEYPIWMESILFENLDFKFITDWLLCFYNKIESSSGSDSDDGDDGGDDLDAEAEEMEDDMDDDDEEDNDDGDGVDGGDDGGDDRGNFS